MSVFLPLFLLFFLGWFGPHYKLPPIVAVIMTMVMGMLYACVFIPETHGRKRLRHRGLAVCASFGLIAVAASLIILIPLSVIRIYGIFCVLIMTILPIVFLRVRKFGESYIIQAIYFALFFSLIMLATYLE